MCERLRKEMPGLARDNKLSGGDTTTSYSMLSSSSKGSVSSGNFWSKHRDDVSCNQLQKFWSELSLQARHDLLRIDKQTLFEQARKNMYCSRCNGLLLEGFLQIVMYGKSLQQEGTVGQVPCSRHGTPKYSTVEDSCLRLGCIDDVQDPSLHPWGGLTTTRDGTLTLLDCYLYSKSLKGLQNVFGSARARERERELLYPDACGGGGRGWISQGMTGFGRGHGTRETCALHTARLSVDTLVDFWSALGEETRRSLLKMKEEDFMERLMYRFDSKRFCRDCRKNVIREFKELKEIKRMKREARCTTWFCVADTSLQYEVTLDTIQADWHQDHSDSTGTYHYYEWAVGTGEGKSDILEFENVGLNSKVQVNGLDLTGLNACYITLRAWKMDGRCNEISVKAHALKGLQCVHCRLIVGDGFVTITRGEGIRRFFEHAEEVEEEEDDDSLDKDGNELDGECSRPQKHAKSPELAREFLLDAATVIFKEQVEKAFREGTARQNAHSTFVSLALKLLEERVLVACKDIITLEKQYKLLEEEEKEKRDEEERKERRKAKEKEKKLRRKERLKSKEKDRENKCSQPNPSPSITDANEEESTTCVHDDPNVNDNVEDTMSSVPILEDHIQEEQNSKDDENSNAEFNYGEDENISFRNDQSKHPRRKLNIWKDYRHDQSSKWCDRQRFEVVSEINKPDGYEPSSRSNNFKPLRSNNLRAHVRYSERLHCSHNRTNERDPRACGCYQHNDFKANLGKQEPHLDVSKPYYRVNKYNNHQTKSKIVMSNGTKKVWEPTETLKRYVPRRNLDSGPVNLIDPANGTDSIETNRENNDLKSVGHEVDKTSRDLSRSSNSNSDSCLSCLSEGDGNTSFSSNTQNPGSSSTSDSEETSLCLENGFREFHIDKEQNTNENATLREELPPKKAQSYENGIHPQGNIIPPQIQPQKGLNFPFFQAPSGGYYHQCPVQYGLAPMPYPNHYMLARPFGYGLNPNPHFIQYGVGSLQPLAPPLPNHSQQQPTYQPAPPIISKKLENGFSTAKSQNENSEKLRKVNSEFSLFHFGGPVALSNGFKPDTVTVSHKEEIASGDAHCCGKDAIEEYNLFAASNGIKFFF